MLTKKQLKQYGQLYGSVEAYYMDQLNAILNSTADERNTLQEKFNNLQLKYNRLVNRVKKSHNEGYKRGYQEGLEEGWKR